jgi:hypothetical protein
MSDTPLESGIIYRWEPPDTSYIAYIGDITGDHQRELIAASWRHRSGDIPHGFVLIDVSRLRRLSAEAREISSAHARQGPDATGPVRGTAIFGASFHIRVIANFGTKAYNLLKRQNDNPVRFFDTEAAARAWLAERRVAANAQATDPPR